MSTDDIFSLLHGFLEITPALLRDLTEAANRRDGQASCLLAHRLKGSVSMLFLVDLAHATAAFEEACGKEDWNAALAGLGIVLGLYQEAGETIRTWIARESAKTSSSAFAQAAAL